MVHAVKRYAPRGGEGLSGRCPDEESAGQARPHGGGHRIWLRDARLLQRRRHHLRHSLKVGTGGNFGHDAAKPRVLFHGGGDDVGEDLHVAVIR